MTSEQVARPLSPAQLYREGKTGKREPEQQRHLGSLPSLWTPLNNPGCVYSLWLWAPPGVLRKLEPPHTLRNSVVGGATL